MRLMILGSMSGPVAQAGKIAMKRGVQVTHCEGLTQTMNALRSGKGADLIMCDVKFDIKQLIESLDAERISVPVVACGVDNDAKAAVKAIKDGAKEYVPLPPDAELIAAVIEAVADDSCDIIAQDPAMMQVIGMAKQVAPSTASVLISGESGTGKELIARLIHTQSKRKSGPFIALNCAAIPETLMESELFGHEKGAFTGATARRLGKFEEAASGTIFLDEISEMAIDLQAKLLRAIQEKEIVRLGSNTPVKVDVRIVATTNRRLQEEVKAGTFREDLYYRLNVINLVLPPLKDRPQDIALLAKHFAEKFTESNGMPPRPLDGSALAKLQIYPWPGNVRELENTMHRAVLLAQGDTINDEAIFLTMPETQNLTTETPPSDDAIKAGGAGGTLAAMEKDLLLSTVDKCLGDHTAAAKILGISLQVLRKKLNTYTA